VSMSQIMGTLFNKAASVLSDTELAELSSDALGVAQEIAGRSMEMVEGIGCLVANEAGMKESASAGNFQSADDVPTLLFLIGNQFDSIQACLNVIIASGLTQEERKQAAARPQASNKTAKGNES
jgi:hypothetical protein